MATGGMPLNEAVDALKQSPYYRVVLHHLAARRDKRIEAAIKADEQVDVMRGRAQELIDIVKDLGG